MNTRPPELLLLAALAGCAPSDPGRAHSAREASGSLRWLGGYTECSCTWDEETLIGKLYCEARDDYEVMSGNWAEVSFAASQHRHVRSWSPVTLRIDTGYGDETIPDAGRIEAELGDSMVDPTDPDSTTVWLPLTIHHLKVPPVTGNEYSDGNEEGYVRDGRYWCQDMRSDPWDVDPGWLVPPPDSGDTAPPRVP
jgi:hypothetical protein